jgi:hypothetical protein
MEVEEQPTTSSNGNEAAIIKDISNTYSYDYLQDKQLASLLSNSKNVDHALIRSILDLIGEQGDNRMRKRL